MPAAQYRVVIAARAEADLYEIEAYWIERGEPERGEKYFRDLHALAVSTLRDAAEARLGRSVGDRRYPEVRSFLAFGVYRILYWIDEVAGVVNVLRFWHTHRGGSPLD